MNIYVLLGMYCKKLLKTVHNSCHLMWNPDKAGLFLVSFHLSNYMLPVLQVTEIGYP